MMEDQLITDFRLRTGANQSDALCCLRTWGWDLKKALIDYNDTSTTEYFNGRAGLKVSMDYVTTHPNTTNNNNKNISNNNIINNSRKPSLTKSDSIDIVDYKKLYRGISRATETNVNLVSRARTELGMDFHTDYHKSIENFQSIDTPEFTFTLPDLTVYPDEFRKFLEKDLIECSTLNALETSRHLNWWADTGVCRKLWPLATTGDGNCLLHAASLAMWGFHDRKLTLRAALYGILSKHEYRDAIWRRWRFQQTRLNKQAGFVYSEIEWAKEWDEIVTMASPEPRRNNNGSNTNTNNPSQRRRSLAFDRQNSGDHHHNNTNNNSCGGIDDNATYESLEEIHIFALAHVLRRTIIVISDTVLRDMNGEAMAPIPFGGVYLPFEIPANECHRAPLLLTYDMAHFSALVAMESPTIATTTTTTTTSSPSETILNNLNQSTTSPTDESSQQLQQLQQPPALIPLISYENILLPIQFCIDPGEHFDWRNYDGSEGNWTLTDREHIALLKEYLDIIYASPLGLGSGGNGNGCCSPDEEIYDDLTDEEIERRIGEAEIVLTDDCIDNSYTNYNNNSNGNGNGNGSNSNGGTAKQSKAAKQLQSVAKQFGSIGKNMSKKIKKNIGSITKIGASGSGNGNGVGSNGQNNGKSNKKLSSGQSTQSFTKQRILCARLKAKRHVYQEEMIRNYLECAQNRFLANENTKDLCLVEKHQQKTLINNNDDVQQIINQQHCQSSAPTPSSSSQGDNKTNPLGVINESTSIANNSTSTAPTLCINVGCINYGTSKTSYMCPECFENQKQHELHRNLILEAPPRYGTGNSRFYTQSDMQSHKMIKRLPSVRRLNELDQTLYLSNSTFYNDNKSILNDDHHHRSANIVQVNGGSATTNNLNRNSNNNNNNGPNTTYRHGYSPTENTRAIVTRRIPITIEKRNDLDDDDDDDDDNDVVVDENDLENNDYNRNSANNKLNNNYLNNTHNSNNINNNNNNNTSVIPWGTVRVYSPGNTVRQNGMIQQQHHISIPIQKEDLILLGNDSDYDNVDGNQSNYSIKNQKHQASPVSSVYLNNTTNSNCSSNRSSINNDFIHFDENSRNTTSFLSSRIVKVNTNNGIIMGPPATSSVPVAASKQQNGTAAAAAAAQSCRTHGCLFYGSPDSNYYCSKCYPTNSSPSLSTSSTSSSSHQRHQQQQQKTQSKILTDV